MGIVALSAVTASAGPVIHKDGRIFIVDRTGEHWDVTDVLDDKESGTLWYPYRKGLMGIQGKYFKRWLEKRPFEDTRWKKWKAKHPDSQILD
jgi:hypothetical protein